MFILAVGLLGFYLLKKPQVSEFPELAECEKLEREEEKDSCFSYWAFLLNDVSLCDKVSQEDGLNLCKAVAKGDPLLCKDLKEDDKNGCYHFIACIKKDPSICDEISNERLQEQCKTDIEQEVFKDLIAKREEYKKQQEQDESLIESAVEANDSSICVKINNTEIRDECYNRIGINTENVSLCDKIEEKDKQQSCKAYATKDIKYCENIEDNFNKDWCYSNLAFLLNDVSLCDKIPNENQSILCKAIVLKDSKLCEKITIPFLKEQCLETVK